MRRFPIVAAVLIAAGIGIIDPYACVQYGTGGSLQRDISKKERDSLLRTARRARDLVSPPGTRYAVDRESDEAGADTKAPWDDPAGTWMAPGAARAIRIYYPIDPDAPNAPPAFETRIHVNAETGMPRSLATIFGDPRPFRLEGAAAIEIPTVATDDEPASGGNETEGGRVALPTTSDAALNSITLLRVLVSAPETEEAFRAASEGKAVSPPRRAPVDRADRVESITVEFYGARKDVERVARRLPVAKLRALLSR
jgi:hypothetical protein